MQRIIFISNSIYPLADSGGGSVVLYRHLKRFEKEGKEVIFINSLPTNPGNSEFKEVYILKKKWYPPIRKKWPFLTNLRVWLEGQYIRTKLKPLKGDVILSILGDYTNLIALQLSKRYMLALHMIYHDDSLFNKYEEENILTKSHVQDIFSNTTCFYAVSTPMLELLKEKGASRVKLLYPIPEGANSKNYSSWKEFYGTNPNFCYAGMLLESLHLPILKNISQAVQSQNGCLTLLSNINTQFLEKLQLQGHKVFAVKRQFKTLSELFNFFLEEISSLMVFYSFDSETEPRMVTSFPSKFCEFVHLGIPIIIIAPAESAIGKWAADNYWKAYISSSFPEEIEKGLSKLKNREYWEACSRQSKEVADRFFNPEKIHDILRLAMFGENTSSL